MLRVEEVDNFLVNKLNFNNWKNVLEEDREEFLKLLVKKHVCNVYFHNLGLPVVEPDKRSIPTLDQILETGLTGNGGLCNQLNVFIKTVLDSLGYETMTIAGSWSCSHVPGTHCMTIVTIGSDKMYLVDVASGSPNWQPVPLHALPFKGTAGGYAYEFRLAPDEVSYQRIQYKGSLIKEDFKDHEDEVRYTFQLKPPTFMDIEPAMSHIYTNSDWYLMRHPIIFRHMDDADGGLKFILVWGKTFVKGKRDSREIIQFENYDGMKTSVKHYFPKLNRNCLDAAFEVFKRHECIPYRF